MIDLRKGNPPKSKKPTHFLIRFSDSQKVCKNTWSNRGSGMLSLRAKHPEALSISGGTVL